MAINQEEVKSAPILGAVWKGGSRCRVCSVSSWVELLAFIELGMQV